MSANTTAAMRLEAAWCLSFGIVFSFDRRASSVASPPVESIRLCAYLREAMTALGSRDLQAVLGLLEDCRSRDSSEVFTKVLVDRLAGVVGCDYARYHELDTARRVDVAHVSSSAEEVDHPEQMAPMMDRDWDEYLAHPCYRASLAEVTGIFRLSDLARRNRLSREDLDLMALDIGPMREESADRLSLQISAPGWAGFVFDRCDAAFHAREHELARLLQVHLGQLWTDGARQDRLRSSLSALEHDDANGVLLLTAAGTVAFASASAQELMRRYLHETSGHLPADIEDWHAVDHSRPLLIASRRSVLVIEAVGSSALLLHEQPAGLERLTYREREIMGCVEAGLSNLEIGRRLWVQPATVRKHLEHVYDKLGVHSRTAALAKTRGRLDRTAPMGGPYAGSP